MNLIHRQNKKHTEEPAYSVVKKLGGGVKVARELGITPGAITRWMCKPDHMGSRGGVIPQKHWDALIKMGRERGVLITLESLKGWKNEQ